jgi:hypothetical protein
MTIAPNETAKRIQQIRTNAIFGKKKHYNAADRKQRYQSIIGMLVISINVVLGSAFLLLLKESVPEYVKWGGAILALMAALLATFQNYFGYQKKIQGHRVVAGQYLDVMHQCSNALAAHSDRAITDAQLVAKLEKLTLLMAKIDSDAHAYPTNDADFQLARSGIENGEEEYTSQDLRAGS